MSGSAEYPETVEEVLNDESDYREATVKVMEAFRDAKPWSGSVRSRMSKFYRLHDGLCKAYGIDVPLFFHPSIFRDSYSGNSYFDSRVGYIYMTGKLSVITYLHEFGHALKGPSEHEAVRWSVNLYRLIFPNKFKELVAEGHFLRSPE